MGTQYGAKKMDVLKRQISTTMIAGIVFSIAVTLFCILFARPLLLLIRVQEEVLPLAVPYLRIVFLGFIFTFIYNFFACTLRALGDSTTPLYFLVASSVLNIIGICFSWQCSDGAAWAARSQRSSARRCVVCFASFTLRERCRS